MKYYLPILLQNKNINILQIDKNIKIRKITHKEREEFFGIEKIDFGFKQGYAFINSMNWSKKHNGRYGRKFHIQHVIDGTYNIFASNYIIECNVKNDRNIDEMAKNLNISFNISKPTNTRCYIGFNTSETGVHFPCGYRHKSFAGNPLDLNKRDLADLPIIYKKIKNLNHKERLKFNLFMDGLHNSVSIELKFLSLVMALENMFLPDGNTELKLRFSLRIAKIINEKITKKDKKGVFELAVNIYDIRSKIIHSGCSKKLTNAIYAQTVNLVWVSLVEYINHPEKFKEQYLKDVLL